MAQTINGKIVDENNSPLYGVSVYFDGTTIGTTTDNNGFFELNVQSLPNATLVISYIGYESVYLNTIQSPIELKLEPSSFALKEVVLEPIPFSRKEMLKVFREQFLGKTKGGKNCVVLNEDAIQFSYTSKEFKLTAFADEKIKVKNNYLGYIIEVDLVDFYVAYNKRTLSNDYLRGSYFAVTSFFKEIEEVNKSYEKNRNTSYLGSSKHFFKNLIEKKWGKKEFL
ncbi:MAG: calcium-binding protein, partial [Bacteroidetes bacterium HGW-Bacteroidetes-23]